MLKLIDIVKEIYLSGCAVAASTGNNNEAGFPWTANNPIVFAEMCLGFLRNL